MSQESGSVEVRVKRVYDAAVAGDGYRVLVDGVWPRGMSRDRARLDEWARDLAPSPKLRRWFAHDPAKFDAFRARYRRELAGRCDRIGELGERASSGPITLVYAARDELHNNAVVLAEVLHDHARGRFGAAA
jgi:uncharacterized protein YeaO (DUF488 family)